MTISFSHLGEDIVAKMADTKRRQFIKALNLPPEAVDWSHVQSVKTFAYSHCELSQLGDLIFDGQHKIDVALWVKPESAFALELKLGKEGLSAKAFNTKFLSPCGISHNHSRVTGSMIAILEGLSTLGSAGNRVSVKLGSDNSAKFVELAPRWGLVVQQSVLDSWARSSRPALSENVLPISIQHLVDACCERGEFNELVTRLLPDNFYDSWLSPV